MCYVDRLPQDSHFAAVVPSVCLLDILAGVPEVPAEQGEGRGESERAEDDVQL